MVPRDPVLIKNTPTDTAALTDTATTVAAPTTVAATLTATTTAIAARTATIALEAGAAAMARGAVLLRAPTALELKAASDEAIAFKYQEAEDFRKTALDTAGNHHDRWLTSLVDCVVAHPNILLAVAATKHLMAIYDDVSPFNFVCPLFKF
jgi:hypothetical protein